MNELLLLIHTIFIAASALAALKMGKQTLIAFICLQSILANLFVVKQISLFGFNATAADPFIIGMVFSFHLLQEYYGKKMALQTIWSSFTLMIFYTIASQIHLFYIPHAADTAHHYFAPLLGFMPRIAGASLTAYFVSQQVDYRLYALIKKLMNGRFLVVRNYSCAAVSQFIDTVLFSFLGLYGIIGSVWQVILVSYIIKMSVLLLTGPFMALSKIIRPHRTKIQNT